jgi:hypothetical protein
MRALVWWHAMLVVLLLVLATAAQASRYHAYSCRMPSGAAAPVDGWSGSTSGIHFTYAEDTCSQGGALTAALGDEPAERQANIDVATWALELPSPEKLAAATLWRAGDTAGGAAIDGTYQFWFAGPAETAIFGECIAALGCAGQGDPAQPLASENRLVVPTANLGSHLYMKASCGGVSEYKCPVGTGDARGYSAVAYLYAADLTIEQNQGPSVEGVSGPLASEGSLQGTSDLVFGANDPGAGIYQALFSVDGRVVQSVVLDENGGRCRNVGQTADGSPAFLYLRPCLKTVKADVGFDTTLVPNGPHHLVVMVSDAAGNAATVLDRNVVIDNVVRGPCNATCDERVVLRSAQRRTLTRRYADSNLTLTGQLRGGAGPVSGALIELHELPSYPDARDVLVASTRTDAIGSWRLRVPKGPSRLLTVGFRSHLNDSSFAAKLQYRETVRAGVALSAPRRERPGDPFAFRGRLAGGFVPPGGVLVSLEIFYAGQWREIALLRTNRRGAFAYRYAFAAIGPATYRFRAQVPQTIGYPFASAASASRYIHLTG